MELIEKSALVAWIKNRFLPTVNPNADEWEMGADAERVNILNFIDSLEVKEMDLETDIEKEYIECNIDIFNRKFPNLPKLNGQYLHDYKNFLNTCKQIFKFHYWNNHPTQEILFEKLSLLWSTWGAQHLKNLFEINSEGLQKMDVEVKEVDLEKELDFVKDAYYYFTSDERSSMKKVAKYFFELGLKAQKGE